ncbi:hypothetical protein [Streptomyces sp. URMC 123]|uniref:hypothetical protein n=1 Tax=Streptomyces sp. URMC 123 TaxID=3423403 RepID=UPI003F1D7DDA
MSSVPGRRPARVMLWSAGGLLVVGAVVAVAMVVGPAVHRLWNGEPYPATDPDQVAARLKGEVQRVYDEAGLGRAPDAPSQVEARADCYYSGLKNIAHIDQGRPDSRSFELRWQVTGVAEAAARSAQERTRLRLASEGWKLTHEFPDEGFRFEHPATGDLVDVGWYRATRVFAVSTYAPCGKVPDGFDEYRWPNASWTPQ